MARQLGSQKKDHIFEDKARELEGTLDWMRQIGISPFDESESRYFVKAAVIPSSRRTPQLSSKVLADPLTWIRQARKPSRFPSGEFEKLNTILRRNQINILRTEQGRLKDLWIGLG
jgi:hypothetical protein